MELERWIHAKENGDVQTLLVSAGQDDVTVGGLTLSVAPNERLQSTALAFSICLARVVPPNANARPSPDAPRRAIVSFAPNIAHPPPNAPEIPTGQLLLQFSELLSTWAGHFSQVGLRLSAMEEVDFGRVRVDLIEAPNGANDVEKPCAIGPALALLALALEEIAAQRDVVTGAMRLEHLAVPNMPTQGHWGAHLANAGATPSAA